jgi:hypothetical protein
MWSAHPSTPTHGCASPSYPHPADRGERGRHCITPHRTPPPLSCELASKPNPQHTPYRESVCARAGTRFGIPSPKRASERATRIDIDRVGRRWELGVPVMPCSMYSAIVIDSRRRQVCMAYVLCMYTGACAQDAKMETLEWRSRVHWPMTDGTLDRDRWIGFWSLEPRIGAQCGTLMILWGLHGTIRVHRWVSRVDVEGGMRYRYGVVIMILILVCLCDGG